MVSLVIEDPFLPEDPYQSFILLTLGQMISITLYVGTELHLRGKATFTTEWAWFYPAFYHTLPSLLVRLNKVSGITNHDKCAGVGEMFAITKPC